MWSPDGERLVFSRDGALVELEPNGGQRIVLDSEGDSYPSDWSADGELLLYHHGVGGYADVWMLPLSEPEKAVPLVQTASDERQARFSPDDRWIAYASNESGRAEVYVRPIPPAAGWEQVSTNGGAQPMWRRDGKELFYVDLEGVLHGVPVEGGSAFVAGDPVPLFQLSLTDSPFWAVRNDYAVSPDGQRFLVASVDPADRAKINVVVDWESVLEP